MLELSFRSIVTQSSLTVSSSTELASLAKWQNAIVR